MKPRITFRPLQYLLISLVLVYSSSSLAARWYSVEVILFEHLDDDGLESEYWESDPGLPDYQETSNRLGIDTLSAQAFPAQPYRLISYDNRRLRRYYNSLKSSRRYRPIFFKGWTMPVQNNRKKQTLYLEIPRESAANRDVSAGFGSSTPMLEGTLKITVGRFLHVHTDFLYRRNVKVPVIEATAPLDSPITTELGAPDTVVSDAVASAQTPTTYVTELRSFKVNAHRRMRSKKIHYIDHPAIGMLVLFHPIKARSSVEVSNPLANLKKEGTVEESTVPVKEDLNDN